MTYEEAVEYAKNVGFCCGCPIDMSSLEKDEDPCKECEHRMFFEMVIEALEKQIPKKPTAYHVRIFGDDEIAYDCPHCKHFFATSRPSTDDEVKRNSFCHICGQAIDWGDEE